MTGDTSSRTIYLCECFGRDGLQNEAEFMPTDTKIEVLNRMSAIGFPRIEVTSFAHPGYVPQFADAEEVFRRINREPGITYKATCTNERAADRASSARSAGYGPDEISFPISASEAHNLANTRRTISDSKDALAHIAANLSDEIELTATVATAFRCPFTGPVDPSAVEALVEFYASLGIRRIIIGDTSGAAYPNTVLSLSQRLVRGWPNVTFIAHFHDNRGAGLANVVAAIDSGITHFDCSFGGLGGHPAKIKYAAGQTGNVSTEDLVCLLSEMGYATGIDLDQLIPVAEEVERAIGRQLHGKVTRSGLPSATIPVPVQPAVSTGGSA